ncbi:hypothetical protein BGL48_11870 [Salinivibrio sp. SS3]|uniref:Uncharacterized protein n=1 Tax=Salinivibrio phage SMHB1 TaxID=1897436 RepID=A0A1D9C9R8_9CAUD|nr:hypothetical protein [Salinivibrio sp. BNH]YP_009786981.1 hypothetical protein HOR26_gp39 [Salinivibrio phage SMHB1]AOY11844.1 hypothetical protein [Salinivibrio phage SMHB1]ODP98274.1 hypothetical protein BGL48_11870 [Salinivibrio sp. BNH]
MADWVTAVATALGVLITIGGVAIAVVNRIGAVARELSEHKTHVAENYATKDDVKDMTERVERQMEAGFSRIYKLLEKERETS